jgi:hypothetical protein
MSDEATITQRLEEVLQMILCPVSGCWTIHGCHCVYLQDDDFHALEVWPVGVKEEDEYKGNGHKETEQGLLYELAEFDFTELTQVVPLEHFNFSQHRQVFEIGWLEFGKELELRVHIEPDEGSDDGH